MLDSGSTDRTIDIATELGARVVHHEWLGYGAQKRHAIGLAQHDWILNLDADEAATEQLAQELRALQNAEKVTLRVAYAIPRHEVFLGRRLARWGCIDKKPVRFFDRRHANFDAAHVHENVQFEGKAGRLRGPLLHESYRNLHHYFEKFNTYTTLGAKVSMERGIRRSRVVTVLRGHVKFFMLYIVEGHFLCGWPGFVWCWLSAGYGVVKSMKQMELEKERQRLREVSV